MAKIRGVKPELWTDENFVELSAYARLLWIGLWNHACDNGHLQDKSKQIKMRVLPTDDVNCADLLREIEAQRLIKRADGWITIPNLSHHQKPHKRWWMTCDKPGCVLPEGASHAPSNRGATVAKPVRHGVATADGEGDGEGDVDLMVKEERADKPPRVAKRRRLPDDFKPADEHVSLAQELGVDLRSEWALFVDHWRGNGETKADWDATLRNWIRREAKNRRGRSSLAPVPRLPHARDIEQPPNGLSDEQMAAWMEARA